MGEGVHRAGQRATDRRALAWEVKTGLGQRTRWGFGRVAAIDSGQ